MHLAGAPTYVVAMAATLGDEWSGERQELKLAALDDMAGESSEEGVGVFVLGLGGGNDAVSESSPEHAVGSDHRFEGERRKAW
jgi:hypothetical protein